MPNLNENSVVGLDSDLYFVVDHAPEFPGGIEGVQKFFAENLRYPIPCVQAKIEGRVVCSFVVDKTGEITDIEVVTPVHPLLDAEAVRIIKAMPKWIPGRIGDKPVRVRYSLPIRFKM